MDINQREADILAAQLKVEQLKERDHMLTAQNEMLKENNFSRFGNEEFRQRLMLSEKRLSNVNNELAWYRKSDIRDHYNQNDEGRLENRRHASAYCLGKRLTKTF